MLVLLSSSLIWKDYDDSDSRKDWPEWIILGYSIANAFCNVACGMLSDYLSARRVMDQTVMIAAIQGVFGVVFLALGILTSMPHNNPILYAGLMVCPG